MMKLRGKKSTLIMALLAIFMLTAVIGCGGQQEESAAPDNQAAPELKPLKLATTTSTDDSGLLDYLLPEFQKDTNYQVEVIAVGTGQAIEMGEAGDVDVLLVHSRAAEDKFVADGFGVDRRDVMYNDFLIIGPAEDPAGIKGTTDALAAFKAIADKKAAFVSRGDDSGTHKKELTVWQKAEVEPPAHRQDPALVDGPAVGHRDRRCRGEDPSLPAAAGRDVAGRARHHGKSEGDQLSCRCDRSAGGTGVIPCEPWRTSGSLPRFGWNNKPDNKPDIHVFRLLEISCSHRGS